MKLQDQVCSLELAQKLKTLGVKQESYLWWWEDKEEKDAKPPEIVNHLPTALAPWMNVYAAFTVAELGEMLPKQITIENESHYRYLYISNGGHTIERWYVYYELPIGDDDYKIGTEADTEADARAKMLIYLIENKLMTP